MSAEAPAPERARSSLRFSARDLVGVAIFAVIFIVVTYAIGMLGVISPLTWLVVVPTATLANGVTFMLFVTRVRHAGMITLLALVIALFYLLTGNSVLSTIGIMAVGALADLVAFLGRYRSRRAYLWSYSVFGLSSFTPFIPLLVNREEYFNAAGWKTMGEDYMRAADALLSAPVVAGMAFVFVAAGFAGGLFGSAMLRKHFVRAGLA